MNSLGINASSFSETTFFTSLKLKLGISQFVTYLNLKSQKAQPQLPEVTVLHLGYQKISKPELEV